MWRILVLLLFTATLVSGKCTRNTSTSPPLNTKRPRVRIEIIVFHNYFRGLVTPKATNMLELSWHDGAARQAQAYANKCERKHNDPSERINPPLGACGQNIYFSTHAKTWYDVLKKWYDESKHFSYGSSNSAELVSNYTQMIWSTTHKVGCGVAHCPDGDRGHFYNYVCHYCPGGNYPDSIDFPYRAGPPCEDCLYDCKDMQLCTNACDYTDDNSTCIALVKRYPNFCSNYDFCKASCICKDKKHHRNYPWW